MGNMWNRAGPIRTAIHCPFCQTASAMPRFAANLTLMFNEVDFLARFEAAARAGCSAVEYHFP